ncbi:MAG TPA: hypothetical protein VHA30_00845, partial [Patescibacteria group bacterium]|nr:hypothetical protein [Patescibacteria group bacterium]
MDTPAKANTSSSAAGFENFLVANGFVSQQVASQLQALHQQSGQDFGQLLLNQKILDEEGLAKAKAAFFNIPYVDLKQIQVPPSVLSLIPQESVNFYNFVPFELDGRSLKVA